MPGGVPVFRGARLVQAREARGISAVALSELVGLSAATISQYEHGRQKPPLDVLEKLAAQLNLPVSFFLRPLPEATDVKIFYRSMSAATKSARMRAERRFEWLKEVVDYLESFFEVPLLNLPGVAAPADVRQISTE